MNCREIEPLLYLIREGELSDAERNLVQEHLAGCEHCRGLAGSVGDMTEMIRKLSFGDQSRITDEEITGSIRDAVSTSKTRSLSFVTRSAAALILIMLVSTFLYQEYGFYKSRQKMEARFERSDLSGSETSDCLQKLQRKFTSASLLALTGKDLRSYNLITEEELTRYVRQACGAGATDPGTIKRILIQAGLINGNTNLKLKN